MGDMLNSWKKQNEFVVENLCCKLECLRQEMYVTALEKGISHPDVLTVSQRLDEAINEFCNVDLVKKAENMPRELQ